MTIRRIEIFTGNCPLCNDTVQLVQELADSSCEVRVYNLQEEPYRVHQYGVKAVPAIAIDGILVITGKPNRSQLEAIGLNQHKDISYIPMYLGMGI